MSEAAAYMPDTDVLRATVQERISAASGAAGAKPGAGAGTGAGIGADRRARRTPWIVRGIRLGGVPAGIAAAAFGTAVAVAVGVTVTRGGGTPPQVSQQAGGATVAAGGNAARPGSSERAVTGSPQAATQPNSTTDHLPSNSPSATPSAHASSASPVTTATSSSGSIVTASGKVVSSAQNTYWTEEDVSVTLSAPVTAFQLTVKVSMSPSLSSTGDWTTDNQGQFTISVNTRTDGVYYVFQLNQGQTLPAGPCTFGVQFNHGNGNHNTADDTYYASVITDATHGSVSGTSSGAF
jgi:hypothetical protein